MKNPLINYQNCVSENGIAGNMSLSQILILIQNGSPQTNELVAKARKVGKGTPEYDEIKKNHLPAFLFNFKFNKKLNTNNIIESTGLLYLDIDNIESDFHLFTFREEVKHIPYVFACWKSLSEKGLSVLVSVKGMNAENFYLFKAYFGYWYKYNKSGNSGLNLDENAWKPTQKTVLSRDEDLYINKECRQLTYNEVLSYDFSIKLYLNNKKVQSTLLKEEKDKVGEYTAPLVNSVKSKSSEFFLTLTDRSKYADNDKEYTVYESGVIVNKIFLNKKRKIAEGSRNTTLFVIACKYISMHGEDFAFTFSFLKLVRNNYCQNPKSIADDELKKIVKKAMKNYTSDKIKRDLATIIFPKYSLLTLKEKQSITGKEMGKIKAVKTIKLMESKYLLGMTQKELAVASKRSLRTVKAYWNKDENGNVYFARPAPKQRSRSQ